VLAGSQSGLLALPQEQYRALISIAIISTS
jgi:hypothetical protein